MTHSTNTEILTDIARAIWSVRREHEDRCDQELEDMGKSHPVWQEAEAVRAVIERLGASDAVPVPLERLAVAEKGRLRWSFGRTLPSDWPSAELYAMPGGGTAPKLYDATALASARQRGRNEGLARAQSAIDQALNGTLIDPLNHDDDGLYDIPNAPRGVCSAIRHLAAARQPAQGDAPCDKD